MPPYAAYAAIPPAYKRLENRIRYYTEGERKKLAQDEKRVKELDRLYIKVYEDEQVRLKAEVRTLQNEIEVQERQVENLEQFIQRVHKYAVHGLIKGIYIEVLDKSSGRRVQGIRIVYDLVGFIPLDELTKEETA